MLDKMDLGEFYRELRLARGFKQKDVAHGDLTVSQLSKFELGQSMLSADKLFIAIEGIYMTFDEFGHKLNNYQEANYIQLGRKIVNLFVKQDILGLKKLLAETESSLEFNSYVRLNCIVLKNAIHMLDSTESFCIEDREFLTDYLYSIESWTWFELYLFCNTTSLLSDKDLIFLGGSLLEKSEEFRNLHRNKFYIKEILINLISEMIWHKKFNQAIFFEEELEKILTAYDVFEQIMLQFLRMLRCFVREEGKNKKEIENFIQSLHIIENQQLISLLYLKLEQFSHLSNL